MVAISIAPDIWPFNTHLSCFGFAGMQQAGKTLDALLEKGFKSSKWYSLSVMPKLSIVFLGYHEFQG